MSNTEDKFKGRYEVNDGYAGGARPHHFTIRADDLGEGMDDEALEAFYEEAVQDHFEQHITPCSERLDEFIAWAKDRIAAGHAASEPTEEDDSYAGDDMMGASG